MIYRVSTKSLESFINSLKNFEKCYQKFFLHINQLLLKFFPILLFYFRDELNKKISEIK